MKKILSSRFRNSLTLQEPDSKTAVYLLGVLGYLVVIGGFILFLN